MTEQIYHYFFVLNEFDGITFIIGKYLKKD